MTFSPPQDIAGYPSSLHAEVAILGAMLIDSLAIADATARLQYTDFSLDSHQRIYRSMVAMSEAGRHIDLTTLREEMQRSKELDAVGGPPYLAYLAEGIPRNLNVESYVRIVKDKSILRQAMKIFAAGTSEAMDQSLEAPVLLQQVEAKLSELTQQTIVGGFQTPAQIIARTGSLDEFLSGGTKQGTIATGYAIDRWTNSFKPGQLIIIAGRPSHGKTAWALNIATHSAVRDYKRVAIFSLEMEASALLRRMIQAEARIPRHRFDFGLTPEERSRRDNAVEAIVDSKVFIDDIAFNLPEIRAKARRLQKDQGLDLLIIDYLGLLESPGKSENRTQEVSIMSRGLKLLAKELHIPVVALAQLSRKCEERQDKRPILSDLRDSGSIEQDADIVCFIYRQEVYEPKNEEVRGLAEINVAKHRDGRTGILDMVYQGDITRFEDRAREHEGYHA